eukprot:TRINITY_DN12455_c0_g1_i3.p4 TRINITY_DN12455_c0_g1~~TRINITY_DN12455_c0_g1_i3.p4  ORF type:complete len:106 (+),score=28.58 TRINITY_DN12455_c0_g1_i3:82-399(+)
MLYILFVRISFFFFFLMIRRPPRSTHCISSAASDVYKRQVNDYKSLAEGITYMLTHIELRKKCYKINKERIEDVCEIRKVASLYIALYKKILNSIDTNTNIEHQN